MNQRPDIFQVKVDKPVSLGLSVPSKALQIKIDNNKSVIVYNRVNKIQPMRIHLRDTIS